MTLSLETGEERYLVMTEEEEMVVTPWEVSGRIDYEKLIQRFGTQPITEELLKRMC